ncbi:caspase family protein, partial [Candidatus Bathyarchaeota archaeon]|nr:caspase family protein [Candidatus Bathyarchaeota archaeon]
YKNPLWGDISSVNDVSLIQSLLLKQNFQDKDIIVLKDESATKSGIVDNFRSIISNAKKGDIVFFHFSCHGQQVMDNLSKYQDELDGFDEAIVPYEAPPYYKKKEYTGQNHLLDDELGQLLYQIRQKVGETGDVIVTIDACHSGTATRGFGKSRGTNIKIAPDDYQPPVEIDEGTGVCESVGKFNGINSGLAPIVVISASGQDEANYEYVDKNLETFGSLSYALSVVFSDLQKNMTYIAAFEKIKIKMNQIVPKQTPQIEGNINREVFGGRTVNAKPYIIIKEYISENKLALEHGNLHGIFDGSIIEFYSIGTYNLTEKDFITKGVVSNSKLLDCELILEKPISKKQSENIWGFIKLQNYGDLKAKVKINSSNKKFENELKQILDGCAIIELVNMYPDLVVEISKSNKGFISTVITKDEKELYRKNTNPKQYKYFANEIYEILKKYAHSNLMRRIEMTDTTMNVKFDFIPGKITKGNQIIFQDTDEFRIKITNLGNRNAYYTIVDILPNNEVQVLIPPQGTNAREFKIKAGESDTLAYIFGFDPIYGTEMFKLIATQKPLNLDMIIRTKGKHTRGADNSAIIISEEDKDKLNPLELLFYEGYQQTRASSTSVPSESANIYTKVLKVVDNK